MPAVPVVDRTLRVPRWCARACAVLAEAAAAVRLIATATPTNLRAELARIAASDRCETPKFLFAGAPQHGPLRARLVGLAAALEHEGDLGRVLAARARELEEEAALCEVVGGATFWERARRRFAARDAFDAEADALATSWLAAADMPDVRDDDDGAVASDDTANPRSLLARMRAEIGARRLPFRVVVNPNLASLAATGDGIVQVVAGRALSRVDVERTVVHEIEGHVAPRAVAERAALPIFALGTARGVDDQEGRALAIEHARGFLDPRRRRELGLRHAAARSVEARADFVETARLVASHGAPIPDALRISARVHRGGGLAREVVYVPALLRVEAALRADPEIDAVLGAGRVSVDAARALAPWLACAP